MNLINTQSSGQDIVTELYEFAAKDCCQGTTLCYVEDWDMNKPVCKSETGGMRHECDISENAPKNYGTFLMR